MHGLVGYKSSMAPATTARARLAELAGRPVAALAGWDAELVVGAAVDVEVPREVFEVVTDEVLEVDVVIDEALEVDVVVEAVEVVLLLVKEMVERGAGVDKSLMLVMGVTEGICGD